VVTRMDTTASRLLRYACVLGVFILRAASSEVGDMLMYEDTKWLVSTENHPFLSSCCQGTIDDSAFNQWLVQDRLFVEEFKRFTMHVSELANSQGPEAGELMAGAEKAIDDELHWFQEKILERNADANAPMQRANQDYTVFLTSMSNEAMAGNWPLAISMFFGIEKVYQKAWQNVRLCPTCPDWLKEYAGRWGSDAFEVYVDHLEGVANAALLSASEEERNKITEALQTMLAHEVEFWSMAYEAGGVLKTEL